MRWGWRVGEMGMEGGGWVRWGWRVGEMGMEGG